jgi:4-alpha-glucanotransferase
MTSKTSLPSWISQRAAGILLHITSLPSSYGIGNLGKNARAFVDFLNRAGFRFWQTCPVGPTGYGDSPYQVFSSLAGNPYLIDWDPLIKIGLVHEDELTELRELPVNQVDYGTLYHAFYSPARLAFSRFSKFRNKIELIYGEMDSFSVENESWLDPYACFQALKRIERNKAWWEWPDSSQKPDAALLDELRTSQEFAFQVFLQYLFWGQWKKLRAYANDKNVSLLGDLPIYEAPDSSEVWQRPDLFQVDDASAFSHVAGVPPDYFNENGQYWGNPLYDWEHHDARGYAWWMDRLAIQLKLFDVVRIDHFRGFQDYWSISTETADARNGSWKNGPGMKFWEVARERFPSLPFLAEDLGLISEEVRDLRRDAGLPGMAVLQFAFDGDAQNLYLPHNLENDLVLYTGTHDNDTTAGWYASASEEVRGNFRSYLNVDGSSPSWDMLRLAYRSIAPLVVVPAQDLLGLGSDARFNEPGHPFGNWKWRLSKEQLEQLEKESAPYLAEQAKITGRLANSNEMN